MAVFIFDKTGHVIGRSKNLRGPHDRCRKVRPAHIEVTPTITGGAKVYVRWVDDSWSCIGFFCYERAVKWQNTRRFADTTKVTAPQVKVGGAA